MKCLEKYLLKIGEVRLLADAAQRLLDSRTFDARIQGNAITRSALVLLTGYLEGYIRDILTELAEKIDSLDPPIENLAPLLLASTLEDEVVKLKSGASVNGILDLLRNSKPISLNHKKLAKTGGNPTVETVESLFQCFGITAAIDKLSINDFDVDTTFTLESQVSERIRARIKEAIQPHAGHCTDQALSEIVAAIEDKWNPRTRRRSVGYVAGIEQLLKRRNRIAHGEGDEVVTPTELIDSTLMVTGLVKGLHDLVEVKVENIVNGVV